MEILAKIDSVILPMFAHPNPKQRRVLTQIHDLMLNAFGHAGANLMRRHLGCRFVMWRIKTAARHGQSLQQIEAMLRPRFRRVVKEAEYYAAQRKRAANAYERIKGDLFGDHLLDLGSGPGLIAETIHERTGMKVTLADVIDYSMTNLPTIIMSEWKCIPLDNQSVDTTLIYLVLHRR